MLLVAERPIFIPAPDSVELVQQISCRFAWNPGLAPAQKRKNIKARHEAGATAGCAPLLEISTKSDEELGQRLSAFHLKVHSTSLGDIPLESAFQGSKVFASGGPYEDLYKADVRAAKRDPRLQNSGPLLAFRFENAEFPLEPKTVFYDWLFITAISPHREWLDRLDKYAGFTDIEFNPQRSINCQARSCALFIALGHKGLLQSAVESPETFLSVVARHLYRPQLAAKDSHR